MSDGKLNLKDQVRSCILTVGGLLKEELSDSHFEFGFRFLYPNATGRLILAVQPKGKNDYVELSVGTPLGPPHREKFIALPDSDKRAFVKNLSKFLFESELEFSYEFSQHYTIVLIDKLFVEDDRVSLHRFYGSVRKMHGKTMSLIIFVQEFFSDEFNSIDFSIK